MRNKWNKEVSFSPSNSIKTQMTLITTLFSGSYSLPFLTSVLQVASFALVICIIFSPSSLCGNWNQFYANGLVNITVTLLYLNSTPLVKIAKSKYLNYFYQLYFAPRRWNLSRLSASHHKNCKFRTTVQIKIIHALL